jgi:class 3 adenylate cyclase
MPDKLASERLVEIVASRVRHAAEAGEIWVSEDEIHAMAEELVAQRAHVAKLEAELKYYRDNNRHTTDEYD